MPSRQTLTSFHYHIFLLHFRAWIQVTSFASPSTRRKMFFNLFFGGKNIFSVISIRKTVCPVWKQQTTFQSFTTFKIFFTYPAKVILIHIQKLMFQQQNPFLYLCQNFSQLSGKIKHSHVG